MVPNTLLSCSCNPWPYSPPPQKKAGTPLQQGGWSGGGGIPNSANGGKWRGRRGSYEHGRAGAGKGSCGEGDGTRGQEASVTGVGTSPAAWRRRAGGPGRCRGDCDECEANAGSAARGQKGETAKERLRRQTEPN